MTREFTENETLESIFDEPHIRSKASGWWSNLETGEDIELTQDMIDEKEVLVMTEISESVEGKRASLMDDKLPHRSMIEVELADVVIRVLDLAGKMGYTSDSLSRHELSDCPLYQEGASFIRFTKLLNTLLFAFESSEEKYVWMVKMVDDWCSNNGYDLIGAACEKMAYNANRADHKIENRKKEGGKQF